LAVLLIRYEQRPRPAITPPGQSAPSSTLMLTSPKPHAPSPAHVANRLSRLLRPVPLPCTLARRVVGENKTVVAAVLQCLLSNGPGSLQLHRGSNEGRLLCQHRQHRQRPRPQVDGCHRGLASRDAEYFSPSEANANHLHTLANFLSVLQEIQSLRVSRRNYNLVLYHHQEPHHLSPTSTCGHLTSRQA